MIDKWGSVSWGPQAISDWMLNREGQCYFPLRGVSCRRCGRAGQPFSSPCLLEMGITALLSEMPECLTRAPTLRCSSVAKELPSPPTPPCGRCYQDWELLGWFSPPPTSQGCRWWRAVGPWCHKTSSRGGPWKLKAQSCWVLSCELTIHALIYPHHQANQITELQGVPLSDSRRNKLCRQCDWRPGSMQYGSPAKKQSFELGIINIPISYKRKSS